MVSTFADRSAAGRGLADRLLTRGLTDPVVLGLARGGVEVAAPVAAALHAPLDVLVVRKVAHPGQPELGLGALAEDGPVHWDADGLARLDLCVEDLTPYVAAQRAECARRVAVYRRGRDRAVVYGREVVVVDDGVATGVSARAALRCLGSAGASRLVLAAPVVAAATLPLLAEAADEVVALLAPRRFGAVSRYYRSFPQTSDETVVRLLATARQSR